ncbi:hypothetical protein [Winogradskyella sp.]|uniref:hypothetical protein n=1 Tax=Winogradskyella sp. TaxID=1883156 RepID=UPI003BAD8EA2
MNLHPEYKEVQRCIKLIEEKLQWGNAEDWHNDVFAELSEKIYQETNVLLSKTTLKRVWGKVKYTSKPSISTLNTLSQFVGFQNWRHFKNSTKKKQSWFEKTVIANKSVILITSIILAFGFISLFSMLGNSKMKSNTDLFKGVVFSSEPVTKGLPNSVIFNFDLNGISSDSIYIQQFWDITKTIKIEPNQKQATGIYYFPGHFNATLLVDGEPVKQHSLFIKSEGWMGTIDYEPIPKYLGDELLINNSMRFSRTVLDEISNSKSPLQSSFHYVDDFASVSGDNIKVSQSLGAVINDKWAVCQSLKIVILGTEGALVIPFSQLGCVSDLGLLLNDVFYSGKKHDLSAFGVDLNEKKTIDILIKNKNVSVSIEGKSIYEGKYNASIGTFVGVRYRFLGAGEIDSFKITDLERNTVILQ